LHTLYYLIVVYIVHDAKVSKEIHIASDLSKQLSMFNNKSLAIYSFQTIVLTDGLPPSLRKSQFFLLPSL